MFEDVNLSALKEGAALQMTSAQTKGVAAQERTERDRALQRTFLHGSGTRNGLSLILHSKQAYLRLLLA